MTGSTTQFVGNAVAPLIPGMTIVRTRGMFNAVLAVAASAGDGYQGAFGIGMATTAAILSGIAAVPTPITEAESDGWLYWAPVSCHAGDATAGSRNWDQASQRLEVDSKAMRKFGDQLSIYAAIELVEIGVAELDVFFDSRVLVMLP